MMTMKTGQVNLMHCHRNSLFDPQLKDVMEPDAQELYKIRNHLEHSHLRVHEILLRKTGTTAHADPWTDRLAFSVSRDELNARTIQLYRLARAGLIYLALGMHLEEKRRNQAGPKGFKMPMTLEPWQDNWKR